METSRSGVWLLVRGPHVWQGGKEEEDPPGINKPGRKSPLEIVSPTDAPAFNDGADVTYHDGYVMMLLWSQQVMIYSRFDYGKSHKN